MARNRSGLKKVTRTVRRKGKSVQQSMWVRATAKVKKIAGAVAGAPLWAKRAAVVAGTTLLGVAVGRAAGGRAGAAGGRNTGSAMGGHIGAIGGVLAHADRIGGPAAAQTARNAMRSGASPEQVGRAMFGNTVHVGRKHTASGAPLEVPIGYHLARAVGEREGRRAGQAWGAAAGGSLGFGVGTALSRLVR